MTSEVDQTLQNRLQNHCNSCYWIKSCYYFGYGLVYITSSMTPIVLFWYVWQNPLSFINWNTPKNKPVFQHVLNGKLRIIDTEMEVLKITHTDDAFHTEWSCRMSHPSSDTTQRVGARHHPRCYPDDDYPPRVETLPKTVNNYHPSLMTLADSACLEFKGIWKTNTLNNPFQHPFVIIYKKRFVVTFNFNSNDKLLLI